MPNSKQLALLKSSVDEWNVWRREQRDVIPDLKGAYLRRVRLERVNLSRALLFETNFRRANLSRANFRAAHLGGADLSGADLSRVSFRRANLNGANLSRADLRGADFSNATFGSTVFGNVDLSEVRGLDTVTHAAPSSLGVDTLFLSGGSISEIFLRGCGLPGSMIALAKSLVTKPPRYYSAFISYAHADSAFAKRLHADLQMNGVRVWFAPEDLRIGETIQDSIDAAIRLYDKLILVLSQDSLRREWVRQEFSQALAKEKKHGKTVLFPIRLDDAVFETTGQWASNLKKRHIGDFRAWTNPLKYQAAINRLLRDLNAGS